MNNNPNRDEGRKEKSMKTTMKTTMTTWTRRVTLGAFITMNLAPRVMQNLMMQTVPAILLALAIGGTILAEEPSKTRPAETPAGKDAFFDWQKLNAAAIEEYRQPPYLWKPGVPYPGGRGVMDYMYAPNFAFEAVPGAKHYRFTVTHCTAPGRKYRVLVYESPVLPTGQHTLKLRVTDGYSVPDYVEIDTPSGEHATNTVRVNDATVGAGTNQFEYVGKWTHGRGAAHAAEACLEGDISYSNTAGDTMQIRFSGTRVRLYGALAPHHGTGMVSVDDGKEREAVFRSDKVLVGDKTWVFEAAEPWAALTPVWTDLPVCVKEANTWLRLVIEGLDGPNGKSLGKARIQGKEVIEFRKKLGFQGPLFPSKVTLREASLEAIRASFAEGTGKQYTFYKDHRLPIEAQRGPELARQFENIEPVFVAGAMWIGDSMTFLARESQDPKEVAMAIKTARNAADTLINTANPAGWKYANYVNMVRNRGKHWKAYLSGEKTYEEWLADMHDQSAARYEMMQDCRACEPGFMFLDVYDVTKDAKYLEAAKRLAAAYRDTQLPSGMWPYWVNGKTGQPLNNADYPPALTILFLDRLANQYGVHDYEKTADLAFQWVLENQVKVFDHKAHFHDIGASRGPGGSQGALAGTEIAMCLFGRGQKNPQYIAQGEQYLRMIEEKFISWDTGMVSEQTVFMTKVGFTGGGVAQGHFKAYELTGNPLYLAKALKLSRALNGNYLWKWYSAPRAAICLLEAYPYLKKNNLPGGE